MANSFRCHLPRQSKGLTPCTNGQFQTPVHAPPRLLAEISRRCSEAQRSSGPARLRAHSGSMPCVAAAAVAADKLADLDLQVILNQQGLIQPSVPEGTEATVFAIFDEGKKLQYVGFSKDCRNTLRSMFTRRPDKTFYYKALHLPKLEQQAMMDIRSAWFEEVGGAPNGNRLAIERNYWQLPISCGAISDRGKQQAAEQEVEMLRGMFATRGCKEELIPDPKLLAEGKVDFLPAQALTEEDLVRQRQELADRRRAMRNVVTVVDGNQADFEIIIDATYTTKGGYIFDVRVIFEERETPHRVIIGKEYYEDFDLKPEQTLDRAFAYLISKKVQRQTEGLMMNGEFPINYFSISTIEQYFDDFGQAFLDTGKTLRAESKFWRFNKVHDYGEAANRTAKQLADSHVTA